MVEFYTVEAEKTVAHWLPDFCGNILDDKINGVALSCFARLADYMLTYLSSNYVLLCDLKSLQKQSGETHLPTLTHFPSGVPLYSFEGQSSFVYVNREGVIVRNGRPIYFNQRLEPKVFSEKTTAYVTLCREDKAGSSIRINSYAQNTFTESSWGFHTQEPTVVKNKQVHLAVHANADARLTNRNDEEAFVKQHFEADPQEMRRHACGDVVIYENMKPASGIQIQGSDFLVHGLYLRLPCDAGIVILMEDPQNQNITMRNSEDARVMQVDFKSSKYLMAPHGTGVTPKRYWEPVLAQ